VAHAAAGRGTRWPAELAEHHWSRHCRRPRPCYRRGCSVAMTQHGFMVWGRAADVDAAQGCVSGRYTASEAAFTPRARQRGEWRTCRERASAPCPQGLSVRLPDRYEISCEAGADAAPARCTVCAGQERNQNAWSLLKQPSEDASACGAHCRPIGVVPHSPWLRLR